MSIQIKPIPEQFKNADSETKNQLRNLALEEALKDAVSENELEEVKSNLTGLRADLKLGLKELKDKLDETYSKATQANRKVDIANLELSKKADKSELHSHAPSQLDAPPGIKATVPAGSLPQPRKKEPSFWSELVKLITNPHIK